MSNIIFLHNPRCRKSREAMNFLNINKINFEILLYIKTGLEKSFIKELIEKLFTCYRESFADARKTLDKYALGIAHHKVLHLLSIYEGITISELLNKLKITKQSLNRVLKDLIKLETVFFEKNQKDTRVKHVFLSNKGKEIFQEIFKAQKKRIYNALLNSSSEQVINFDNVLKKIINE